MDFLLGIILGLVFVLGVPIAAFVALARSARAQREIAEIRARLATIQQHLLAIEERLSAGVAPAPAATPVADHEAAEPLVTSTQPVAPPDSQQDQVTTPAPGLAAPADAPSTQVADKSYTSLPADSPILRVARKREETRVSTREIWSPEDSSGGVREAAATDLSPSAPPAPAEVGPHDGGESSTPPPAPPAPPEETRPPAPSPPRRDIEESLGTRWTVWLGGVTLALGGLFLVKYSIDQGVFGPRVRIASGLAFALLLLAAGEWLRRSERRFELGGLPSAHIPSILTAAGVTTAFGVVWAAYALYGMLSETTAFLALGAVGIGALLASTIHGPGLAALGLVGSYGTPFLVGSESGSKTGLVTFLAVVSAVAFAVAWRKEKRWIAWSAIVGHAGWGGLLVAASLAHYGDMERRVGVEATHLLIGLALAAVFLVWLPGRRGREGRPLDELVIAALAIPSGLLVALTFLVGDERTILWAGLATIALLALTACRFAAGVSGAVIASIVAVGIIGAWPAEGAPGLFNLIDPFALLRFDFPLVSDRRLTVFATAAGLLIALPGFAVLAQRRWTGDGPTLARGMLAFSAALAPVAILASAAIRLNGLFQHLGAAAVAAALCLALAAGGEILFRGERERRSDPPTPFDLVGAGAFLAAAAVALGLAVALALPRLWLAVGLAIASAGVAFVLTRRPAPALASMSGMLATAAVARVIFAPLLDDVGTWPVLNWLLAAYGMPALAFAAGAYVLRGREPVRLRHLHEGLAIAFAALTVATEIRQYFVGPDLLVHFRIGFGEVSLAAGAAALLALATAEMARHQPSPVIERGALIFILGAAAIVTLGLGFSHNPLFTGAEVERAPPFNRVGWGYGLPLAATAFAAWRLTRAGDRAIAAIAQIVAAVLAAAFVLLQVRRGFQGPDLHWSRSITLAEGGFYAAAAFAGAAALAWLRDRVVSPVFAPAASVATFAGAAVLVVAPGLIANPLLRPVEVVGPLVGRLIFDNALIGFALPAALAALAAWLLGRKQAEIARVAAAAGAVSAIAYFVIEVRHFFHGSSVHWTQGLTLAEGGIYVTTAFASAAMLAWLRDRTSLEALSPIAFASVVAGATVAIGGPGLGVNPLLRPDPLAGSLILDNALIGFALPAAAAAFAAWRLGNARREAALASGAVAILGALAWLAIELRRVFQGPLVWIGAGPTGDAEWYAYSVLLVLFGVALLALGFLLKNRELRLASAIVILAAALKVFLYDMAGLEGIWRALSFIVLGLVLMGIGLVYQRLLAGQRRPLPTPS